MAVLETRIGLFAAIDGHISDPMRIVAHADHLCCLASGPLIYQRFDIKGGGHPDGANPEYFAAPVSRYQSALVDLSRARRRKLSYSSWAAGRDSRTRLGSPESSGRSLPPRAKVVRRCRASRSQEP